MFFYIENLDFDICFDPLLDDKGFLNPHVWDIRIDFGDSYIQHDSYYVEFLMYQALEIGKVIIQNSAFFFGDQLFSSTMGPMLDEYL